MKKMRKGFTLVELLIVIVVIGILSAMMMLSSTEATTSAKATAIVSNLRNLKTAALAYYADNMDYFADPNKQTEGLANKQDAIRKYLGNKDNSDLQNDEYIVTKSSKNSGSWFVSYEIKGSEAEMASIKKKLAGRAKSLGLKGSGAGGRTGYLDALTDPYTDQKFVVLQVR